MKKILIVFIVFVIFCFAGCGAGSNGVLAVDEFNIYENNKMIATPEEFTVHSFSIAIKEGGNYAGRDITSKRGIKIGSTVRELAEAYKGVPALISVSGSTEVSKNIPYNEFLEKNSDELSNKEYGVWYNTYIIDNKTYDTDAFEAFLEEKGIDTIEYLKNGDQYKKEYKISSYTITFYIKENIVTDIQI